MPVVTAVTVARAARVLGSVAVRTDMPQTAPVALEIHTRGKLRRRHWP